MTNVGDEEIQAPSDVEENFDEMAQAPDDAADAKKIAKRRLKISARARQEADFWRHVMSSEIGRYAMWRLISDTRAFETRFACGPNGFPQDDATWFNAGQQDVGQRLYHMLARNDRVLLLKMHDENDPYYATNVKPPKDVN